VVFQGLGGDVRLEGVFRVRQRWQSMFHVLFLYWLATN
jgi:hypothetical protein